MKIRALICIWLVVLLGLATCGAGLPDVGLSSNRGRMDVGLRTSLANGGGVAKVDTVRLLARDKQYPPTAQVTAGNISADLSTYDIVHSDGKGGGVRWGYVRKSTPDQVYYSGTNVDYVVFGQGGTPEDDYASWTATQYIGLIWVNTSGLPNNSRVLESYLMFQPEGTLNIAAGQYVVVRADTVSADYRILTGTTATPVYANTDTARFDASWNEINATDNLAWEPTLDSRLDRHDWGPRSDDVIVAGSYAGGTALKINVTDAVQQVIDNREQERGIIFMVYASVSHANVAVAAGNHAYVTGNGGCPSFVATVETRRGAREWGGAARVPVVFTFDDSYDVQVGYFRAMRDNGVTFDMAAYRNAVNANATIDSLYAARADSVYILHHSRTHASVGSLAGDAIDPELARGWLIEEFTGITASDTAGVDDYSWPDGAGVPDKSLEAASRMVDYGYRAARGFGVVWDLNAAGFERDTYLAWNGWVNLYAIGAVSAAAIFETSGGTGNAANTEAQIREELQDYIDLMYTDYAKSPLILYAHRYDSEPDDFVSEANINYVFDYAATVNNFSVMGYRHVLDLRLAGASFRTPAQVETGRGVSADSNAIQAVAAGQDSAYAVDSDPNYLQMWIGPK